MCVPVAGFKVGSREGRLGLPELGSGGTTTGLLVVFTGDSLWTELIFYN